MQAWRREMGCWKSLKIDKSSLATAVWYCWEGLLPSGSTWTVWFQRARLALENGKILKLPLHSSSDRWIRWRAVIIFMADHLTSFFINCKRIPGKGSLCSCARDSERATLDELPFPLPLPFLSIPKLQSWLLKHELQMEVFTYPRRRSLKKFLGTTF